jgi:acyl-CoA synthetase (AMP-forming)/AMP-acid ligase II
MIVRSPLPDVEIPEIPLTSLVLRRAEDLPHKPALIDGPTGRTLTYGQLAEGCRRVATGLRRRGFGKGDVFGIFAPNLPEYAVAFNGVNLAGGTNTTVNSLYTADEVAFQLKDCGARFLVTVPPFMDRAIEAAKRAGVEEIFVFGEGEGATPFAALLADDGPLPSIDVAPREDVVVLPYSSGTTGFPKGVMLTHHNLVSNIKQTDGVQTVNENDTLIAVLPFFHIYGQVVIMMIGLYRGATIVTMPKFDLEGFLQIAQDHGVTRGYFVPPIVLALAKHPMVDSFDLSKMKTILCGAAPLGPELQEACAKRLGCRVTQGYGMTETSPVTHAVPDEGGLDKPGSIGPLVPNTECRVVDYETGRDLEAGQDGEIWVRGPQVMKGYLNNPDATAKTIDPDGWLHTGDIGHADEDGYFAIVDRLKELIKYKGYQVPPAELEAILLSHPAIADAAVVPRPDEEAGELPKAFVVLKSGASASSEDVIRYVAERVAPQKKVRLVEFVEEIPKSASGKILRRILVERERASLR